MIQRKLAVWLIILFITVNLVAIAKGYDPHYPKPTITIYLRDDSVIEVRNCYIHLARKDKGYMVMMPGTSSNTYIDPRNFSKFVAYSKEEQKSNSHCLGDLYLKNGNVIRNIRLSGSHLSGLSQYGIEVKYHWANDMLQNTSKVIFKW